MIVNFFSEKILQIGTIVVVGILASRFLQIFIGRVVKRVEEKDGEKRSQRAARAKTIADVVSSVGNFAIWSIVTITILSEFGINITPLLTGAGIVGFAVGFGSQTLIRDFISGFFILLENQFSIGDKVTIAGKTGVVKEMRLRSTVLQSENGEIHIIPNSQIGIVSKLK